MPFAAGTTSPTVPMSSWFNWYGTGRGCPPGSEDWHSHGDAGLDSPFLPGSANDSALNAVGICSAAFLFPRVLGMEAAGTVLARGEDVDGLEVGDAVFGFALTGGGTYAETTVLSAPNTARIPAVLSATVAATLPVAGTTAVDALDQLGLPAGATILVNGVGGGVGLAVAQLAAARELRVIGTVSTAKREHAEAIGVRFIDYTAGDVVAAARALAPDGVDGIVDLAGGTSLRTVAPLAKEPRTVISVGDMSVPDLGGRFVERRLDREHLERSAQLAIDGVLAPVITAVHPLSDALATVENGHTAGKVVIKVT